jgi:hypothetical protein
MAWPPQPNANVGPVARKENGTAKHAARTKFRITDLTRNRTGGIDPENTGKKRDKFFQMGT